MFSSYALGQSPVLYPIMISEPSFIFSVSILSLLLMMDSIALSSLPAYTAFLALLCASIPALLCLACSSSRIRYSLGSFHCFRMFQSICRSVSLSSCGLCQRDCLSEFFQCFRLQARLIVWVVILRIIPEGVYCLLCRIN